MNNTIEGHKVIVREDYLNEDSLLEFIKFCKYPSITPVFVKYIDKTKSGNPIREDLVGEINLDGANIIECDGITTIISEDNEHIIEFNNKAVAHYINIKNNNPSTFLLSVYDLIKHELVSYNLKDIVYKELFKKESKIKKYIK